MFNAYHSALLGARGVMALLGIATPQFDSQQYLVDLFPQPIAKKDKQRMAAGQWEFKVYDVVHFPGKGFQHEDIWQAFCRTVHVSVVPCWAQMPVHEELRTLSNKGITAPRNLFLYAPTYWPPHADLLTDAPPEALAALFGHRLNAQDHGFLLRLGCDVYALFESLIVDLASACPTIKREFDASAVAKDPTTADLGAYNAFMARLPAVGTA